MQQSIYINNYRGFTDTTIPLRKVNFFVGENSTGKTSLLALFELLAKPEFWFSFDFKIGTYEFGGYKDIVSVLSQNQTEFQIGISKYVSKNHKETLTYMLHFSQSKDGLPKLVRFSLLSTKYVASFRLSKKQVEVYLSEEIPQYDNGASQSNIFSYLCDIENKIPSTKYKKLPFHKDHYMHQYPIILSLIMEELRHENKEIVNNLMNLSFFSSLSLSQPFIAMAPIRTTPKRTYDGYSKTFNPEGEHTPYIIRRRLPKGSNKTNDFKKALEKFGTDSGLFESVGITKFGKDSASPFELTITLTSKALKINSVGYGVSQVLPIVVELISRNEAFFAIQQPEVHLHPKAQAALGDLLYHTASKASHTLFVETHSDYLIDRYRTNIRNSKEFSDSTQVIFFERTDAGNHAYIMPLDNNGNYPEDQPPGFRSFFLKEQMRILGI